MACLCRLSQSIKAGLALGLVSLSLGSLDPVDLLLPDVLVVDLEHVKVLLLFLETILVDSDNDLSS